ncbi:MAG: NAD(P)/FAD-dependent oxidoreductase [Phycisphaerae bacterium]
MSTTYDIAILGAGPVGLAGASLAAKKGLSVAVLNPPSESTDPPISEWVPPQFFKQEGMPGGLIRGTSAKEFRRVVYHNSGRDETVLYKARKAAGYLLNMEDLTAQLKQEATDAGVKIRNTKTAPTIKLEEDHVQLTGTTQVRAKMLIACEGQPHSVIGELAIPMRTVPRSSLTVAALDIPIQEQDLSKDARNSLNVVEMPERSELGMFFATETALHLRVVSSSAASGNRAEELSQMLAGLQEAGRLPTDLSLGRAKGAVWRPPSGVALELETHVAKRCLLAGTAGGFVGSITGHTLMPGALSMGLAVDAMEKALKSDNPQDTLMGYKKAWRKQMADYLRPPNTSLHMLLPLLFVNRRIVSKFTRALLYGENI